MKYFNVTHNKMKWCGRAILKYDCRNRPSDGGSRKRMTTCEIYIGYYEEQRYESIVNLTDNQLIIFSLSEIM